MSDYFDDETGLPAFRIERDDELAVEAQLDDNLQTVAEPIRPSDTDSEQATFANITEDLY